jgi:hypothetical protein
LNHGLALCRTEFIARMDDDDLSHPTRLEEQVAYLQTHPEVGLLGTQIERMGTRRIGSASVLAVDHETICKDIRRGINQMYHPTIMCRTSILRQIGGYWTERRGEEWDMFLRMSEHTRLANLDRVLLSYRIHAGSLTGSGVLAMRRAVEYACDSARRRRHGLPPVDYEHFVAEQTKLPWWQRANSAMEAQALAQYRRGLADVLGHRPTLGYLRLAGAALCSPLMTHRRIVSELRKRIPGLLPGGKRTVTDRRRASSRRAGNAS